MFLSIHLTVRNQCCTARMFTRNITSIWQCIHLFPTRKQFFSLSRCSSNTRASTAFSSLLAQKSPLYSGFPACCIRGEYSIRGSTLIILSIRRTSHYDYNGITVPYWGRSEVVFPYPYSKALPPYMLLSVEP